MKKLISLVLILCMACMLVPAMADEDVAGTWYMIEMTANGVTVNPAEMGVNWILTLNADGTAVNVMEMMGEKQEAEGTWTIEGSTVTVTIQDTPQTAEYADGKLTLDASGQVAVFSKEEPVVAAKPAPVAAESEDAFLGNWDISAVEMMGMYISKDLFSTANMEGFSVKLTIEPGKVTINTKTSADADEETATYESRFEDGKLIVPIDLGSSAEAVESLGIDLSSIMSDTSTIELLENGGILYGMNFMGMTINVYMEKTDAAAEAPAA